MEISLISICCAALDSTCVDTLGSVWVRETKTDRQRQKQDSKWQQGSKGSLGGLWLFIKPDVGEFEFPCFVWFVKLVTSPCTHIWHGLLGALSSLFYASMRYLLSGLYQHWGSLKGPGQRRLFHATVPHSWDGWNCPLWSLTQPRFKL